MSKNNENSNEVENEMLTLGVYALVVRGVGNDLLMGKNVKHYIQIKGLEALLKKFVKDLDILFKFIYENNVSEFLSQMSKKFGVDLMGLKDEIERNLVEMRFVDSNEVMIQYMIIAKTLEEIREKVYKNFLENTLKPRIKQIKRIEINEQKFDTLKGKEEEDFSLLYNMIFIDYLANIYSDKTMKKRISDLMNEKMETIIQSIK
jgi:hypothetical protein